MFDKHHKNKPVGAVLKSICWHIRNNEKATYSDGILTYASKLGKLDATVRRVFLEENGHFNLETPSLRNSPVPKGAAVHQQAVTQYRGDGNDENRAAPDTAAADKDSEIQPTGKKYACLISLGGLVPLNPPAEITPALNNSQPSRPAGALSASTESRPAASSVMRAAWQLKTPPKPIIRTIVTPSQKSAHQGRRKSGPNSPIPISKDSQGSKLKNAPKTQKDSLEKLQSTVKRRATVGEASGSLPPKPPVPQNHSTYAYVHAAQHAHLTLLQAKYIQDHRRHPDAGIGKGRAVDDQRNQFEPRGKVPDPGRGHNLERANRERQENSQLIKLELGLPSQGKRKKEDLSPPTPTSRNNRETKTPRRDGDLSCRGGGGVN